MSHDIEYNFTADYWNDKKQCQHCNSCQEGFCNELEQPVPLVAHCDFFQSKD